MESESGLTGVDWLKDFVAPAAAVVGILMAPVIGWIKHISGRVQGAHDAVQRTDVRVTMLEVQAAQTPQLLREIKDEISGMRGDGRERQKTLFDQIEKVRLELKADLASKQDKA